MADGFIDPERVETILAWCVNDLENDPEQYTAWEQDFLYNLEDWMEENVCTQKQWEKLSQIHRTHSQ